MRSAGKMVKLESLTAGVGRNMRLCRVRAQPMRTPDNAAAQAQNVKIGEPAVEHA